jgi:Ser-tRNA(Ala) deacylase AlaX
MTRLIYLEQMQTTELDARVVRVETFEEQTTVFLDATIFYPQGGGQPYDTGSIESAKARFLVQQVRWRDDEVAHIGSFEQGTFAEGDTVHCQVDPVRRSLLTRIHSAGHVVDLAVERLGYGWKPGKGYHFPDGPYVEYAGELSGDKESVRLALERTSNEVVAENAATQIRTLSRDELEKVVRHVPDYVSSSEPARVVFYGDFGVPCGGTHVAKLGDIGPISVRKLKGGAGTLRVSYGVS